MLSLEVTPDVLTQLNNIILKCESQLQTIEYDYFDDAQFTQLLKKRFPEAVKKVPVTFDFSDDTTFGADDNKEVFDLKRALDLSTSKVSCNEWQIYKSAEFLMFLSST